MNPYSVIMDEMVILHNPDIGKSEEEQSMSNISELVKRWVRYEYFYSSIDKPFFEKKELAECLSMLKIPSRSFKRAEWIVIRRALGKSRRLSWRFLASEREKLEEERVILRALLQVRSTESNS